jgi:hypothetical protein
MHGSDGRIEKVEAHCSVISHGLQLTSTWTYRCKATYVDDLVSFFGLFRQIGSKLAL